MHLDVPPVVWPAWYTKHDIQYWSDLKAKRIDLVIKSPQEVWIVEITPKLSKAAIGGVYVYRDLYIKQFHPKVRVRLAVVCEVDDPAYRLYAAEHDINVWVV